MRHACAPGSGSINVPDVPREGHENRWGCAEKHTPSRRNGRRRRGCTPASWLPDGDPLQPGPQPGTARYGGTRPQRLAARPQAARQPFPAPDCPRPSTTSHSGPKTPSHRREDAVKTARRRHRTRGRKHSSPPTASRTSSKPPPSRRHRKTTAGPPYRSPQCPVGKPPSPSVTAVIHQDVRFCQPLHEAPLPRHNLRRKHSGEPISMRCRLSLVNRHWQNPRCFPGYTGI